MKRDRPAVALAAWFSIFTAFQALHHGDVVLWLQQLMSTWLALMWLTATGE